MPPTTISRVVVKHSTRITTISPLAANVFAQQRVPTTVAQARKRPAAGLPVGKSAVTAPPVGSHASAQVTRAPQFVPVYPRAKRSRWSCDGWSRASGRFACFSRLQSGRRRGPFAQRERLVWSRHVLWGSLAEGMGCRGGTLEGSTQYGMHVSQRIVMEMRGNGLGEGNGVTVCWELV